MMMYQCPKCRTYKVRIEFVRVGYRFASCTRCEWEDVVAVKKLKIVNFGIEALCPPAQRDSKI